MISQPIYAWYHIQYTCDIISTIFMTSYPLCMTSQSCVLMTPHSAYVWHLLNYRRCHIHFITPNHSIYFVTSTSGMTSHPLIKTSHPLYLCHHYLSTDITPSFVWHQTLYICVIICTIYNITFTPYVITLLYLLHHNVYVFNYIQYIGQHIHCLCDITATNPCHHTHCIDNITPTLFMTSHSAYGYLLHYRRHHIHSLWHQTTIFITPHPIYLTSYPHYLCHHIHCIDVTTSTVFMRSHLLYMWT